MKEALLEPILRKMRVARVLPAFRSRPGCVVLDIGCGWEARLLRDCEPYISKGFGIDFKAPALKTAKICTTQSTLVDSLPYEDATFDIVTMLAVLEHLTFPRAIVSEILRVLKPGGTLLLTVPSRWAKPVLEFLAYRCKIVSEAEIRDHKQYYDKKTLTDLLVECGFVVAAHRYFQLGMNNFCVSVKPASGPNSGYR